MDLQVVKDVKILNLFVFSFCTGHLDPGFLASEKTTCGNAQINEEINIASSDSEVEIVGVQEHARYSFFFFPFDVESFILSGLSRKMQAEL